MFCLFFRPGIHVSWEQRQFVNVRWYSSTCRFGGTCAGVQERMSGAASSQIPANRVDRPREHMHARS
jgi:hypothetical protein